jgi:hypothetical protein
LAVGLNSFHTGGMTKRIKLFLATGALAVLFAQIASAQGMNMPLDYNRTRNYTPEEKAKMDEIDKNYQATMKKVPDKQKAYDPWAGARQDSSQSSSKDSTIKR